MDVVGVVWFIVDGYLLPKETCLFLFCFPSLSP